MNPATTRLYQRVLQQATDTATLAACGDETHALRVERVSQWSVGQQLEHLAVVNLRITGKAMAEALKVPPQHAHTSIALLGRAVLWTGYIPRGRGKAPEFSVPAAATPQSVRELVERYRDSVRALEPRLSEVEASAGRWPHPVLGTFSALQWLHFIEVHTRHHLKIVRDIRA